MKLKEYARSKRLDREASRGKQAIDLSRVQNWVGEELAEGEEGVEAKERRQYQPGECQMLLFADKKGALRHRMPKAKESPLATLAKPSI